MASAADNHEKAPICAAFVKEMRSGFPELRVLLVSEGTVKMGEKQPEGAPCITAGDGMTLQEKYAEADLVKAQSIGRNGQ
jgi:hypothetical protein